MPSKPIPLRAIDSIYVMPLPMLARVAPSFTTVTPTVVPSELTWSIRVCEPLLRVILPSKLVLSPARLTATPPPITSCPDPINNPLKTALVLAGVPWPATVRPLPVEIVTVPEISVVVAGDDSRVVLSCRSTGPERVRVDDCGLIIAPSALML